MTKVQAALLILATALYAGQGAAAFLEMRRGHAGSWRMPYLALAALALHACFLVSRGAQSGGLPVQTRVDSAALFLWLTAAAFVAAERPFRLSGIAVVFWPLFTLCAVGMGVFSRRAPTTRPALESTWLTLHLIPIYIGYAGFAVAAGAGLANLIEQRLLHSKRPAALWARLPSLARLDHVGRSAVALGFPLFTVGIAIGAIWALRQSGPLGRAWYGDPKVLAGFASWLVYAGVVHLRLFTRVSARRVAVLTIAGFLVALATFAASHAYARPSSPFPPPSMSSSDR